MHEGVEQGLKEALHRGGLGAFWFALGAPGLVELALHAAPDVVQFESRAISVLSAELEEVLRQRLAFGPGDDEKVGVLTAAFSAVIWYVYTRSLSEGAAPGLLHRLDQAFELLGQLLSAGSTFTTSK